MSSRKKEVPDFSGRVVLEVASGKIVSCQPLPVDAVCAAPSKWASLVQDGYLRDLESLEALLLACSEKIKSWN